MLNRDTFGPGALRLTQEAWSRFWLVKRQTTSVDSYQQGGKQTADQRRAAIKPGFIQKPFQTWNCLGGGGFCVICLFVPETICVVCQYGCLDGGLFSLCRAQSHFRWFSESLGVSLQSFLVLRDSVTSEPSLLCVSAGETSKEVLQYKVQHTGSGMQTWTCAWVWSRYDRVWPF